MEHVPNHIRLSRDQRELVRASFSALIQHDDVGSRFYANLFRLDPTLRPMFRGDMEQQGRKLMDMLANAVAMLNHFESMLPTLRRLGQAHVGYGVEDRHYETVGEALLFTLAEVLQAEFDTTTEHAWAACFQLLASIMKDGAQGRALAA